MHKGMLILVVAAVSGFAQGTWNDLKFGTSLAEVRASLSKQGLALQRSDAGWEAKPRWNLKTPGVKFAFHFTPILSFSDSNKLERIILMLQTEQHKAEGIEAGSLTSLAAKAIQEQLVGKYGTPISQTGSCDRVSVTELIGGPGRVDCNAMWKAPGQTVTLTWAYFELSDSLVFGITYLSSQSRGL